MGHTKNTTLNLFKLFSSYMVVFIHVVFYGQAGIAVDALARFAVPFFFVISGYFSYGISEKKIKGRIMHIFSLIIFSELAYFLYYVCKFIFQHNIPGFIYYLTEFVRPENIKLFLLFNEHPHYYGHLWYLFAILYVYIIFYFATVFKISDKAIFSASVLLMSALFILCEGLSFHGITIPRFYVRNFIFMGIPFFSAGLMARKYKEKLVRISDIAIIVCSLTGIVLSLLSRFYIGKCEIYIGSILILVAPVILSVKYENLQYSNFISDLGDCSTFIYIFHLMVQLFINLFLQKFNISVTTVFLTNMLPVINCIITTALALAYNRVYRTIKTKSDKKLNV